MNMAAKGDAFHRGEVTSSHVTPRARWIASAIVGFDQGEVATPAEAAERLVELVKANQVRIAVHDRETGETVEFGME